MSFNGSGTFNINTAGQPVVTGTVISSSVFNALTADLATGLSTCITKDGQTTVTANIPMNSFKFTGLAAGTAATDSVRLGQLQAGAATLITVTGTNTYAGTMTPALSAYAAGNTFSFLVPNTNTTSCTLNIDGLGAKSITRDGTTALVAGDLVANSEVVVVYDGTQFQVLNSNSKTNFNLSGTLTVAGNTTLSGGTANQVQYLNASKVLSGSANLTFDGTTLTANALTTSSTVTINGGTANGVAYLNGSKVLTTGSALTFDGTNLGVGAAPSYAVDIRNAASTALRVGSNSNAFGSLLSWDNSSGTGRLWTLGAYDFVFGVNSTEQMRLNSTGLGIGTSSPGSKLQVNSTGVGVAKLVDTSATGYSGLTFAGTGTQNYAIGMGGPSEATFGVANKWFLYDGLAGAMRMVVDASGNLGLGVTPSAWSTGKAVQFGVYGVAYDNNVGFVTIGSNFYYNAGDKYKATDVASKYVQGAGTHAWYTAPSGTAGNAITFTQAMTLDASGNLLVGTTSSSARVFSKVTDGTVSFAAAGTTKGVRITHSSTSSLIEGVDQTLSASYQPLGLNASDIRFSYSGTEAARIDGSGNLLVGTTSANSARLNAKAFDSAGSYFALYTKNSSDTALFSVRSDGYLLTGVAANSPYNITTASAANLFVQTDGGLYRSTSSLKYKTDVQNAVHGLAEVMTLRPVTYKGKNDGSKVFGGLIAEEVHDAGLTEFVQYAEDGSPDALAYGNMVSVCIKAIQEQQAIIEELKARIVTLENK